MRPSDPTRGGAEVPAHRAANAADTTAVGLRDRSVERRNEASRAALLHRVLAEFEEMPGTQLTTAQARRLFALREDVAARVLMTLVERALLRLDPNGAYVLNRHRP